MNRENPYKILGVTQESSMEQIKVAFRKLAHIHHPDHGGDAEIFKKVSGAYDYLQKNHYQLIKVAKEESGYRDRGTDIYYEYDADTGMWWSNKDVHQGYHVKIVETKTTDEEFREKVNKLKASKIGKNPDAFNYVQQFKRRHGMS